jgi:hypothetical protein
MDHARGALRRVRAILVSAGEIAACLGIWAALIAVCVMLAALIGGEDWFGDLSWRFFVETGGAFAAFAAVAIMARLVDQRGWRSLGR